MVSAELTKQNMLTDEEKFDRELQEMADDLGVGDIGSSENLNRISVNHQSLATSRSASQMLIESVESRILPAESIEGFDRPEPAMITLMRNLSEGQEADLQKINDDDPTAEI